MIAQHDSHVSLPDSVGSLQRVRVIRQGSNVLLFYRPARLPAENNIRFSGLRRYGHVETSMIHSVSNTTPTQPVAPSATNQQSGATKSKPVTAQDVVALSSAAQSALQEANETPAQTAKEAEPAMSRPAD